MSEEFIPQPKTVMFFDGGQCGVFDNTGQQIGQLQKSWIMLWCESAAAKGIDPEKIDVIELIPSGKRVKLFRTDEGWNYQVY